MSKTILITGASTGFGRDVAETQTNWRAVTAAFRGFIEAVRRVRRERETYHALTLTWSPRPSSPPSAASSKPSMPRTT